MSTELSIYLFLHSFTFFFIFSSQNKFCEFLGSLHTTSMMIAITCTDIIVLFAFLVFKDPIKNNPDRPLFKYGFSLICPIISIILMIINYFLGKVNRQDYGQCRLNNITLIILNSVYCGVIVTFSIIMVVIIMFKGCNDKEVENDNKVVFREFWFYIIGQVLVYLTYISYIIKAIALSDSFAMFMIDKALELLSPLVFILVYAYNKQFWVECKNIFCCKNNDIELEGDDTEISLV